MAVNRTAEKPGLASRAGNQLREPGSGIQFLLAVVAVLIVGVIIALAVHLAMPNGPDSNDPNKEPDTSQHVIL